MQRRDAGRFGRFQNAGVAAGKRGREFPRRHQQREIPGDNLARDSKRTWFPSGKCVLEFIRPTGVIKKMRCHERQVDVTRFLDGFAAIHRLEHGQLARFFLNDARDAEEIFAPLATGQFAPRFERAARRLTQPPLHRAASASANFGQLLFRRGIDGIEIFARLRRDEFAVDEKRIARAQLDVIARFRRGRITPALAKTKPSLVSRDANAVVIAVSFQHDQRAPSSSCAPSGRF